MEDQYIKQVAAAMREELEGVPRAKLHHKGDLAQAQDDLQLMGLAFSGGGIRSATFNLGVLQGLAKAGVLKFADYLSTVSGGGYIGSWYTACLKEGLTDEKQREQALRHLRKFSRYLAPQAGFLSADAWTIAMVWLRNTLLLQTMLVSLFAVVLLSPRFFELWFLTFPENWTTAAAGMLFLWTVGQAVFRMRRMSDADASVKAQESTDPQGVVQLLIVLPLLLGGACYSSALWRTLDADRPAWCLYAGVAVGVATSLTARYSLLRSVRDQAAWLLGVPAIGALCGALFWGLTFGLVHVYVGWAPELRPDGQWLAGMVGAPAILISLSLAVVLQIGLLGRAIDDAKREWWSRLAAFISIYSVASLAVAAAAEYGPLFVTLLLSSQLWHWVGGSITLGGIATTLSGLFAASSRDTGRTVNGKYPNPGKELLARIAPYLFIAGLLIAVSAGIHFLLAGEVTRNWNDHWDALDDTLVGVDRRRLWWSLGISSATLLLLAWRIDIDETSMNLFYRNRLVRCYLGAARAAEGKRHPNLFTGFDFADDFGLALLNPDLDYKGPVPIVNTALNLTGGDNAALEERRAASFFFTPYKSGSDRTGVASTVGIGKFKGGFQLGSCIATSGAAASPNMGYHTSAPVAFLLTFFNVRLGLWLRSPRLPSSKQSARWGLWYLLKELFATADVKDHYLYLSDGGHFENLGVYELVRRRCQYIIAGDAEQDENLVMESLGGLVRKCRIDFDVEIEIDTSQIRQTDELGRSRAHCAVGRIYYKNPDRTGYLIYLKSSLTGDEDSDILQYKAQNPAFPHESTGNQFFGESQFESYRALGEHIATQAFASGAAEPDELDRSGLDDLVRITRDAHDPPSPFTEGHFAHHAEQVSHLWHEIRKAGLDQVLDRELFPGWRQDLGGDGYQNVRQGLYLCQTILQLMQNVYLDLHLDTEWDHPDNKGWKALFLRWAESQTLREAYELSGSTFGDRFRQFCSQRLGLRRNGS